MDTTITLSLVIGATVGASLRTAVDETIAQVGRLSRAVAAAERKLEADRAGTKAKVGQATPSIGRLGDAMTRAEKRQDRGDEASGHTQKIGAAYLDLKTAVSQEGDFEHHLRTFGNTAGITAEELGGVRNQIRAMSTDVNQSNQAILGSVEMMVGKGMGVKQALLASREIGRAATASGTDMATMSNLGASVINTLHVPVDKLGKAFDIMAQAGKDGGLGFKDMAQFVPQLTVSAARLGLTGTEAVSSLSAMLQIAMKGASDPSAAADTLANVLDKITAPETKKNFQKLGIDIEQALADGVAAGQNPVEVAIQQIAAATGADLDKVMADAFDSNGKLVEGAAGRITERFKLGEIIDDTQAQDFLAPMLANYAEYLKLKKKASEATGVVDQDFANMAGTYNEASKRMELATDKLMGSIGKAVLPLATWGIDKIAVGVDALANLADAAPHATLAIVGLVGAVAGYKTVTTAARTAMTSYRDGLGAVARESHGAGRTSGPSATASGRLGGGSGTLGRAVRIGGKALGGAGLILGAGLAAKDLIDPGTTREEKGAAGGNLAGSLAGAATGAAIGSVVPVIGTAAGAIVGGILGSFGGEALGRWLAKDKTVDKTVEGETHKPPSPPASPIHGSDTAAPPGAAAPNPVSITFSAGAIVVNAVPGMDLRALADEVAQTIMQRQRAALAD
jgi:TP901 family phage tail tape measure protein